MTYEDIDDATLAAEAAADTDMPIAGAEKAVQGGLWFSATLTRAALLPALALASKATERRGTIPILGHVLIEAGSDGAVRVTGTNMEQAIRVNVPATVAARGSVTVDARALLAWVKARSAGDVIQLSVEAKDSHVAGLESGPMRGSVPALLADDFPIVSYAWQKAAKGDMGAAWSMPAADLHRLLTLTRHAISTEETRYYLNGVNLRIRRVDGADTLAACATDGHRLSLAWQSVPDGAAGLGDQGIIVPTNGVDCLLATIGKKPDGVVQCEVAGLRMRFTLGSVEVFSKAIDGTYPEYDRVIPLKNANRLYVDAATFAGQVKAVVAGATEKSAAVKLTLAPDHSTVAYVFDSRASSSPLAAFRYTGAAHEVGFQARYLVAMMADHAGDMVVELKGGHDPAAFRQVSDPAWLGVVMPMRV